jgi:hypothetical protein
MIYFLGGLMSHLKHHSLALLPLLTVLSLSPSVVQNKYAQRHLASIIDSETKVEEEYPLLAVAIKKVDLTDLERSDDLDAEKLKIKDQDLQVKLKNERESFLKDSSHKELVSGQRQHLEGLIKELAVIEEDGKVLKEKEGLPPEDEDLLKKNLSEHKNVLESLLKDLKANEKLIAETEIEEPKKEDTPVVVEDNEKENGPNKEETCEHDNKALSEQVAKLIEEQSKIMQSVLGLTQFMQQMLQQQQQQQSLAMWAPYLSGSLMQYPFMYQNPYQGPWTYQHQQPVINIYNGGMGQQGLYPDQFQLQSQQPLPQPQLQEESWNGWNLAPQMQFQDPRFNPMIPTAGNFGMDGFGFNLGQNV